MKPPRCGICFNTNLNFSEYRLLKFKSEKEQKILQTGEVGHQRNWIWFCKKHACIAQKFVDKRYSETYLQILAKALLDD